MSALPGMKVTFPVIAQAQSDVANTAGRVEALLADLKSYLGPLVSTWEGGASGDWQVLQKRWDDSSTNLNAALMQISQMLGQANQAYQSTEMANANAWAM